jgi:hypothetical protein
MYKRIHILHLEIQTKRNSFQKYKIEISLHVDNLYIRTCKGAHTESSKISQFINTQALASRKSPGLRA